MEALSPPPAASDFARADAIVGWADAHGIRVHGHTLRLGPAAPAMADEPAWTAPSSAASCAWYVTGVVGHFRGRVATWDVVNEPLADDGVAAARTSGGG